MAKREAINTLDDDRVRGLLCMGGSFQIFTDGGFHAGVGSAAMVLVFILWDGNDWQREIVGARGILLQPAESSFHSEVAALEMATEFMLEMATECS